MWQEEYPVPVVVSRLDNENTEVLSESPHQMCRPESSETPRVTESSGDIRPLQDDFM